MKSAPFLKKYGLFFLVIFLLITPSQARSIDSRNPEQVVPLERYVQEVREQNLLIQSSRARLSSYQAQASGVNLPPPQISWIQAQDPSGKAKGWGVSQSLPFPTKISSNYRVRQFELKEAQQTDRFILNEVLAQARFAYVSAWVASQKVIYLNEKKSVTQEHLRLSRASTRSDSSLQIHALKMESDFDQLENDILEATQEFEEKQIQLAELAQKNPLDFRPKLVSPHLGEIPQIQIDESTPEIESKEFKVQSLTSKYSETKSQWLPDFQINYRDMSSTPMMPEIKEISVGATLPFLYFWNPRAESHFARAEKIKAESELQAVKNKTQALIATHLTRAQSYQNQIQLIETKILPRAEKRMKLVHNQAPRDMESLLDHLEALEETPNLKLKLLELRLLFEKSIYELSRFKKVQTKDES